MAYATAGQVRQLLGTNEQLQRLPDSVTDADARLNELAAVASVLMDAAFDAAGHDTPVDTLLYPGVEPLLRYKCALLVQQLLSPGTVMEKGSIDSAREDTYGWLEEIRAGRQRLVGVPMPHRIVVGVADESRPAELVDADFCVVVN